MRAAQGRITQMIVTDGTILSARIAGAAYRSCPVAMTFDKQTKQGIVCSKKITKTN